MFFFYREAPTSVGYVQIPDATRMPPLGELQEGPSRIIDFFEKTNSPAREICFSSRKMACIVRSTDGFLCTRLELGHLYGNMVHFTRFWCLFPVTHGIILVPM